MKKKILSFILTGAMLLSALPATIFASADVHDHDHDHDVATIAENGCPGGTSENHNLISCTNYTHVKHVEGKADDCTDPSYDIYQCNVCHEYFVDNFTASSHDFETVSERQEPTCQQEGRKERRECTKCGKVDDDKDGSVIPKKKHTLDGPTKPLGPGNDCTNGGYQQQCSVCHEWITVSGEHDWEFTEVTVAPVCGVSDGFALYTCKNCHTTKTVVIRKEDHQFTEQVIAAGSCTTDRIVVKTCDFCGVEVKDNQGKQHQWLENGLYKDSDCTTYGYTTRICKICGAYDEMKPIPPKGHTEKPEDTSKDDYEAATCTKPETWTCERCDETVTGEPALGHKDVETVTIPAVCGRVSLTFKLCNRRNDKGELICDGRDEMRSDYKKDGVTWEFGATYDNIIKGSYEVGKTKDPSNHLWKLESVTKAPTCTDTGIGVAYCEYCSAHNTNYTIPAKGHTKSTTKTETKATCMADGVEYYECSTCHAHLDEKIIEPKLPVNDEYTRAEAEKYHSVGNFSTWHVIRKVGVNKDDKVDCSISGLYSAYCNTCKKTILIVWDRGHENDNAWTEKDEVKPVDPTCTTDGNTGRFKCIHCCQLVGDAKKLDKLGHQFDVQELEYQAPECEKPGHAEKWVCSRCGDVDPDRDGHTIIQNHKYKTEKKAVAPTCYSVGYKELSRCELCGAYENRDGIVLDGSEIEKLGHTWEAEELSHEVDCTKPTLTRHYCTNEGCTEEYLDYEGEFAAASDHRWEEQNREDARCESDGWVVYECKGCGQRKTETLPALGHQNKDGQKLTKYCDSKDVKDRECKTCHNKIECTIKNVLQHEHLEHMTVEVTCVDDGANVEYCPVCGYSHSDITESAKGHTYDRNLDQAPSTDIPATYAATGLKVWTCDDCGETKEKVIPVKGTEGIADPKDYDHGIQLLMEATNADVGGVEFVDSSTVAVKISLGSYMGLDIWGVQLKLTYDEDVLTFVKSEFVTDTLISHQTVGVMKDAKGNPTGELNINANTPNSQGKTQNTHIQGTEDLVVLYFKINLIEDWNFTGPVERVGKDTKISVKNVTTLDKASNKKEVDGTSTTVTFHPFLDPTMDGSVDIADLLMLNQIINGELGDVEYSAAGDVNKDGYIDIFDLLAINRYINGELTYEEVAALSEN